MASAVATLLMVAVTGCNDDSPSDLPPPPQDPVAVDPASTIDPAHQEILDAYQGSVQAMVTAQAAGDAEHPELTRYFAEQTPALSNVESGVHRHLARGTYYAGELVVVRADVTDLDLVAVPPEAVIESCLDDSDYRLVNRADDTPVPDAEPGGRYVVTTKALYGDDDRWYVVETTAEWNTPC